MFSSLALAIVLRKKYLVLILFAKPDKKTSTGGLKFNHDMNRFAYKIKLDKKIAPTTKYYKLFSIKE